MAKSRVAGGKTTPGTGWKAGEGNSICIYVDTSAADFTSTPVYLCSLSGTEWHCYTVGGNSVYQPDAKGFYVYLEWQKGVTDVNGWTRDYNLLPRSMDRGWCINWIGIERI